MVYNRSSRKSGEKKGQALLVQAAQLVFHVVRARFMVVLEREAYIYHQRFEAIVQIASFNQSS